MPDHHHAASQVVQNSSNSATGLTLAGTGSCRANSHDGHRCLEHGLARAEEQIIRAGGHHCRAKMHYVFMRDVAVAEDCCVHIQIFDELRKIVFRFDGNTIGVALARQSRRIQSPFDIRNLRCRKGNHFVCWVVAKVNIEVMKITSCSP
jgi:hypothetical protein